ncbi:hypothetical protein CPAR01_08077 [Colletotrichum paranaense]|uniref:Uncharacterized protein n=2 Tax=Colletotrichum acutatum species complex TaxID=2707335 RepID=A0ABQ9SJ99_9PEZI|nr:uncharacterized protein CPAR01_08077 [Colletotrichum paranaense]XP_060373562.1 uncharacterized protein CTAM01_15862 [Colletotrichum tamarilloi]KAI3538509.1 hypothetical protein CSPX01_09437 [Colletotrichum filicis]KAK1474591.1 hypothetical protein CTAM01_15862 [Colletotrichum tamarilloi]KAK1537964.1 hypothetical protein CPAR01_08077 [Colletotrichum paranaense]
MKLIHPRIALQIALVNRDGITDVLLAYRFSQQACCLNLIWALACQLQAPQG